MTRGRRRAARALGVREANAIAGNLGRDLRLTRTRLRWTQRRLAERVGMSQAEISKLEAGAGGRTSLETWVAIGIALGRPVSLGFSRDIAAPLRDAGHADAQELVARLTSSAGWRPTFEAPDDPVAPTGSTDLRLDRPGERALVEIWNRLDDLGAAARSSDRKLARAPARAGSIWLLVDTAANRAIVRRYPAILRARFPGSSAGWVRALLAGGPLPGAPGIAWIDVRSGRLRELRLAGG